MLGAKACACRACALGVGHSQPSARPPLPPATCLIPAATIPNNAEKHRGAEMLAPLPPQINILARRAPTANNVKLSLFCFKLFVFHLECSLRLFVVVLVWGACALAGCFPCPGTSPTVVAQLALLLS